MIETPNEIRPAQDEIDWFYQKYFAGSEPQKEPPRPRGNLEGIFGAPTWAGNLSDDEVLLKAREATNGTKFEQLFVNGDCSGYLSQSEADLALCNMLAFWTGRDAEQMARLFSLSALAGEKWQKRADYRSRTIGRAISGCRETYTGGGADRGFGSTGESFARDQRTVRNDTPWEEQVKAHYAAEVAVEIARINSRIVIIDVEAATAEPPPPRKFITKPYLPGGIVVAFSGEGGTGKTYEAQVLSVAIAIGRSVPPFEIEEPGVVLFISVEDDELALRGRLYWIAQELNLTEDEKKLLKRNLRVVSARGALGPLMKFNLERNPVPAIGTEWLRKAMDEHQPDLVVLDTKSRLFGLMENSNDDAAAWVSNLESLLLDRPVATFLVITHVGKKDAAAKENQYGARGASAFVDNCRGVLAFVNATDAEVKRLRATDIGPVFKLVHAKSSYAKPGEDAFFFKNPFGVPVYLDATEAHDENLGAALDELWEILIEEHPQGLNKRDLLKASKAKLKGLRDGIVKSTGLKMKDWGAVIELGLGSGRLIEEEDAESKAPRKPRMIMARVAKQEENAHRGEQQTVC